ncbi:transcriptional regulator, AraC family [Indibacter alkaliphilus LW1]|uniref:Transcriptional regulator, AraC family n=1 Tax=Indibacter alkaliphilus (strain CCUG 57479 / KCTC 22604 / LW1) TaxID=1189612 RepID=S2E1Q6_INDAL|nr:helix-turn-helix domain-containing protein [Indibacter alkaliphilus]EOZ98401.1 transcriptional regulator, AraC family [Indibacter alkaliphilus LW1]
MKHVSILLLHQVNLGGLENARQGLLEANEYLRLKGKAPMFHVNLIGLVPEVSLNNGLYTVKPDKLLKDTAKTDIIIIPPVTADMAISIRENSGFFSWIRSQYAMGAEVVTLCLGAFILGSTGLLDGKRCVTHWKAAADFQKLFPNTKLQADNLLTDENGIYTGGGAFSSANLILYVIEKMVNREAAVYCSKIFQIDMGRNSQSPFIIFKGQKDHPDVEVIDIQEYVEMNFENKITVDDLCERFNMVRRTMERRFKQATGNTVLEYIQRVRVEAAKRNLEKTRKTVSEIMHEVGYSDSKSFRDIFKKYAGISPVDYKNKYGLFLN